MAVLGHHRCSSGCKILEYVGKSVFFFIYVGSFEMLRFYDHDFYIQSGRTAKQFGYKENPICHGTVAVTIIVARRGIHAKSPEIYYARRTNIKCVNVANICKYRLNLP